MHNYIIYLFCLLPISVFAQCDQVFRFTTQGQIDSFQIVHGPCTQVGGITIEESCTATNLYGLKDIVSCDAVAILGGLDLVSLAGLENLKVTGRVSYKSEKSFPDGFPNLDTIKVIRHRFPESDSLDDLSIYKNVKYIAEWFLLEGDGQLVGLENATFSDTLEIDIQENDTYSDFTGFIPSSATSLGDFTVWRCNNLSFKGLQNISTIDVFRITQCDNISLEYLSNLENITSYLSFSTGAFGWDFSNGLEKITMLPCFGITDNNLSDLPSIESLDQLFPNLEKISNCIFLAGLRDLKNIDLLNDIDIPQDQGTYTVGLSELPRIYIDQNPQLENCTSKFLCKALETYPDSVVVSDNGAFCDKESLLESLCATSTADVSGKKEETSLFPNPCIDRVNFRSLRITQKPYKIYDSHGRLMQSGLTEDHYVDVQELVPGSYIIECLLFDRIMRERFIKM